MKKIRWAFIGCGRICHRFIAGIKASLNSEVTAVYGRNLEKARAFAEKYGGIACFDDIDALIRSGKADAAYVALTNPHHGAYAEKFLRAGIPVLCEKPLTANASQALCLIECARKAKTLLMEGMWTRFFPAAATAKRLVGEGRIGRIKSIDSTFGYAAGLPMTDRCFSAAEAGGVLLDLGVYQLSMMQYFMGREPESYAAARIACAEGTDVTTSVLLEYGDMTGIMTCSYGAGLPNAMQINGEKGRILLPQFFCPAECILETEERNITYKNNFSTEGFQFEIDHFVSCMEAGLTESRIMPLEDSLNVIRTMDGIREKWGLRYPFEV